MNLFENVFPEVRQPQDPDLVAELTKLFSELGHPNPQGWQAGSNIQEAIPAAPKLQRFLINRHWRIVLGRQPFSTTAQRFCLQDSDCTNEEFVRVFTTEVAPTIVKHALTV